ncbi:hypothetical protein CPB84DRAFT_1777300 [Gymnopilus junonius]|uniref:Uncharacterized protein n=1 Tax=Gymnopilus junonius TaxID=109634 RepID=A0A9P5NQJ7_GYMJU|nr:hypothetical protein CPB84DRAFT_1777300 [Gymnopilus junonius]
MRRKRASASTGRRVNRVDSKNDLGSPDVHPSEEVGQASSGLSTNRKRKTTEDQVAQTAPKKKARVTKSKAGNPSNSTANQVVSPEPSYDVSQLRRGRSRKLLLPSD